LNFFINPHVRTQSNRVCNFHVILLWLLLLRDHPLSRFFSWYGWYLMHGCLFNFIVGVHLWCFLIYFKQSFISHGFCFFHHSTSRKWTCASNGIIAIMYETCNCKNIWILYNYKNNFCFAATIKWHPLLSSACLHINHGFNYTAVHQHCLARLNCKLQF
jgi:hypothetical protein